MQTLSSRDSFDRYWSGDRRGPLWSHLGGEPARHGTAFFFTLRRTVTAASPRALVQASVIDRMLDNKMPFDFIEPSAAKPLNIVTPPDRPTPEKEPPTPVPEKEPPTPVPEKEPDPAPVPERDPPDVPDPGVPEKPPPIGDPPQTPVGKARR